jgi:hypothetical protein
MGQEVQCVMQFKGKQHSGKALLETNEIIFRGDLRLKIPRTEINQVSAQAGQLSITFNEGTAVFELGKAAPKWAEKILHPPTRAAKFGIKSGSSFMTIGPVDARFCSKRLQAVGAIAAEGNADTVVLLAVAGSGLPEVNFRRCGNKTVWIIYPKGLQSITEVDVINAGRRAGMVDIKVVGFSKTHTALKFVPARKKT